MNFDLYSQLALTIFSYWHGDYYYFILRAIGLAILIYMDMYFSMLFYVYIFNLIIAHETLFPDLPVMFTLHFFIPSDSGYVYIQHLH